MSQTKIAFVVLHYMAIDDTRACVRSIVKNVPEAKIILIDNNSPDGSGRKLENLYRKNKNVSVVINGENSGFSKGNNIGFLYAKKRYNPEYIVLCNNDTVILQKNFLNLVEEQYKKSHFAVLGPKILLPSGKVNEVRLEMPSIGKLNKEVKILMLERRAADGKLAFIQASVMDFIRRAADAFRYFFLGQKYIRYRNRESEHSNIVLHGCFLVFSSRYIKLFDGLEEKTFMYREEEFLVRRLKRSGLKSVYDPKIIIKHNEDASTNAAASEKRGKDTFMLDQKIIATKKLIKEMTDD